MVYLNCSSLQTACPEMPLQALSSLSSTLQHPSNPITSQLNLTPLPPSYKAVFTSLSTDTPCTCTPLMLPHSWISQQMFIDDLFICPPTYIPKNVSHSKQSPNWSPNSTGGGHFFQPVFSSWLRTITKAKLEKKKKLQWILRAGHLFHLIAASASPVDQSIEQLRFIWHNSLGAFG